MSAKMDEVLSFLKELGVENITDDEKKALYKNFENEQNLNVIRGRLDILFAINQTLVATYSKVSIANMLEINRNIDDLLLGNLTRIYEGSRIVDKNELTALKKLKQAVAGVMKKNEETNKEVATVLKETMKESLELKNALYLTMRSKEKADELFNNCINRSKSFIRSCESSNLETIIYCLKKDFSFTDDELVNISKKCASFFVASSVSKIKNLYNQIENFKNYIQEQSKVMSKAVSVNNLLNKNFKEILLDTSSVATVNVTQINKTIRFLSGEKLGSVSLVDKEFFDIKGDFTPLQLAKIYNHSISALNISTDKIAGICKHVSETYKNVFGKKLDLNKFINGNNFTSLTQLKKEDYQQNGKIIEVFEALAMFLEPEDMENLLRNNMSFLIAPIAAVKSSLQKAVLESGDKDELRKNVLQKIKNHFDIYEGGFNNVQFNNEENVYIPASLNKVGVKNINEEELKSILEKLQTSPEDIEKWENRWNKEEKEYRDLAVQLDLEKLIKEAENVKEFSDINFESIEQFEEELEIVLDMFEEIDNDYKMIIEANKLNKQLTTLANSVYKTIEQAREKINCTIDATISMYNDELSALNAKLSDLNKTMKKNVIDKENVDRLDNLIMEKQISKESNEEKKLRINEIEEFIRNVDTSIDNTRNKENEISNKVNGYYLFLKSEYQVNLLDANFSSEKENSASITEKFYGFISSLENADLISNMSEKLPFYKKSPKITYKEYRNSLNEKERKITDEIFDMCKENLKSKEQSKTFLLESFERFIIDRENKLGLHEKFDELKSYYDELKETIKENNKILNNRKKYNKEEIVEKLNLLQEEKEKLDKSISECSKKIDELLKKQIKR